jgi:hypothetical protein
VNIKQNVMCLTLGILIDIEILINV